MNQPAQKLLVGDVTLGYRSARTDSFSLACDGLSFDVAEGEFVAIVGPSGCGKTSFLSAVAGLLPVTSGRLELNGEQILGPSPDRSLVFQQASLFPWRTVEANIAFGLKAQQRLDKKGKDRVAGLVELVGLSGKEGKYPRELSGGMGQRVNLARALATDPDLLLLDEPFSALDAQTREVMQEELTRIWQADRTGKGKTAVFVTHDVPEAVFLADRVVVFSDGPARLLEVVEVDLARPRDAAVKRSAEFQAISDYILRLVMSRSQPGRRASDHDSHTTVAG
ncbi:NitT/TauT family transport system ATP-binding protein [Streptomyces sp. Amel2xB2]|uniref:ABC transporter ATP-binding protein n=1 Tax=Streptomyces TaxID=1883 RepID=UPI00085BF891|nr:MULTISPECIES: ABC transporter ATP-binding protein [Streptomyces]RAJ71209.1 NitT/TauT family transport system ATP-binding protein [Streptomyces sp. Amel2xB2]